MRSLHNLAIVVPVYNEEVSIPGFAAVVALGWDVMAVYERFIQGETDDANMVEQSGSQTFSGPANQVVNQ